MAFNISLNDDSRAHFLNNNLAEDEVRENPFANILLRSDSAQNNISAADAGVATSIDTTPKAESSLQGELANPGSNDANSEQKEALPVNKSKKEAKQGPNKGIIAPKFELWDVKVNSGHNVLLEFKVHNPNNF
jgi:hypothetical protein